MLSIDDLIAGRKMPAVGSGIGRQESAAYKFYTLRAARCLLQKDIQGYLYCLRCQQRLNYFPCC